MEILVPRNMEEVTEKIKQDIEKGINSSEVKVIQDALLEEVQNMLDGDLEGHYWTAEWTSDKVSIRVLDVLGKPIDIIHPVHNSFIDDFRADAPDLFRNIDEQIKVVVGSH